LRTVFEIEKAEEKIKELEKETQKKDFWRDFKKAKETKKELSNLKEKIRKIDNFKKELDDLKELSELIKKDESLEKPTVLTREITEKIQILEKNLKFEQEKILLAGKYDKNSAILTIIAGAGGRDAQDWVVLLQRMYERYCQNKEFRVKVLSQTFGEGGGPEGRIGVKHITLEIIGDFAYGFLKKESGVHRLVRISPFSPQKLRHTSFALVEVIPEVKRLELQEIKIKPDDLKIDFFRASGPGGQYVNKRETAVRITHLPTDVIVSCQSERFQGRNREIAMKILISKLLQLKEKEKQKEISEIKGSSVLIEWGNQIRSYVFHPYKLVKDVRTGVETANTEDVLDGNLDKFIEAETKMTNS